MDKPPSMRDMQYNKAYLNARELLLNPTSMTVQEFKKVVKVLYIQGPSQVNKTSLAECIIGPNREVDTVYHTKKFWSGVEGSKIALYHNWRCSDMQPGEFVRFIDYARHSMNIRGSSRRNNYELIIITSVEKLRGIYRNTKEREHKLQWERRCEVIDLYSRKKSTYESDEFYNARLVRMDKSEDEIAAEDALVRARDRKVNEDDETLLSCSSDS